MKKTLKVLCVVMLFVSSVFIEKVKAYDFQGENTGIGTPQGAACGGGFCFYNSEYGIRVSIVNKDGVQRGNALDVFIANTGKTKKSVTNYSRFSDNTISVNYPVNFSDLGLTKLSLSNLVILQSSNNNFSTVIDDIITGKKWEGYNKDFDIIKNAVGLTSFNIDDYLIIEPIGIISNNASTYYYGTAKDLVSYINSISGNQNPGTKALIYQRFGNSIFSRETFTLGLSAVKNGAPSLLYSSSDYNANLNTNYPTNHATWSQYAYGAAIYKIDGLVDQCKIGVNNNSEVKYNWITYDSTNNQYVPVSEGCCYNYSKYGISKADVEKYYPQCFDEPTCAGSNKKDPASCSLNRTSTTGDNKPSSNVTNCLTSNKYYGGVIDSSKRVLYGCYYSDELSLPGYYSDLLNAGNHFVWPTDDTLLQFRPTSLLYNVIRKNVATCYAYTIDENTGYHVPYNTSSISISSEIVNKVRKKIKDNGVIKLKQNNKAAGIYDYSETDSHFISQDNGYFKVVINGIYRQNGSHEDSYRYYDNAELKYLTNNKVNNLDKNKKLTLYKYPYMFLPINRNFNIKNNYVYGIEYELKFSDIKLDGYYSCVNPVHGEGEKIPPCKCPTGTENAGLDLTNYYVATKHGECKDVGKESICAVLIDEYCNSKSLKYKCPNRDYDLTDCVKSEMANNPSMMASMAYNKCVYEKCNCDGTNCDYKELCPPVSGNDSAVYRTVFLDNPFPSIGANIRIPGSNWGGKNSLLNGNIYGGLVKKYIIDTQKYMYDKKAMYSITLTPNVIKKIKNYNVGKNYDDFNLECQNGGRCYSNFIHEVLPGYSSDIVKGTCGSINSRQKFYNDFDACRQNSFSN